MKYCGPWMQEGENLWVLRDLKGYAVGFVSDKPENNDGPNACYIGYINQYDTVEIVKRVVEKAVLDNEWVILTDKRLRVMA